MMNKDNLTVDLINRHLYKGLKFCCRDDDYRFISLNEEDISIEYFDRIEEIPFELFYNAMMNDNQDQLEIWKDIENKTIYISR